MITLIGVGSVNQYRPVKEKDILSRKNVKYEVNSFDWSKNFNEKYKCSEDMVDILAINKGNMLMNQSQINMFLKNNKIPSIIVQADYQIENNFTLETSFINLYMFLIGIGLLIFVIIVVLVLLYIGKKMFRLYKLVS